MQNALEKITRLRGVTFKWADSKYGNIDRTNIGLIAQEVNEVIPEIVVTNEEGYMSLGYDKLTSVLIEAVEEQQKQIDSQQTIIEELLERVSLLESK